MFITHTGAAAAVAVVSFSFFFVFCLKSFKSSRIYYSRSKSTPSPNYSVASGQNLWFDGVFIFLETRPAFLFLLFKKKKLKENKNHW